MSNRTRVLLGMASVGLIGSVSLAAVALNPHGSRLWLAAFSVVAAALAVQAISSHPRDLAPALLFALVPVVGLASEGAPAWLGAPFAVLLLLACELSTLSWDVPDTESERADVVLPRLWTAGLLAALCLGVAALVGAAGRFAVVHGTVAVALGSAGVVLAALVVFGRAGGQGDGAGARDPASGAAEGRGRMEVRQEG